MCNLCEFSQLYRKATYFLLSLIQEPTKLNKTNVDHLFELPNWGSTLSKSGKIRRFDDELFWESYNAQCYIFQKMSVKLFGYYFANFSPKLTLFFWKVMIIFSDFSLWSTLWNFYSPALEPQRKQEKLAKVSLWPKCLWPIGYSGQCVILAKV